MPAELDAVADAGALPRPSPRTALAVSPTLVASVLLLCVVVLWALFPSHFAPADPLAIHAREKLLAPSPAHLFGTDPLGRDLFSRFVWGAHTTLLAAGVALLLAFTVSTLLGLLAGYLGGIVDDVISRCLDVLLAVPGLLIALMLVTGLGFGSLNVSIAVGVSSIASVTRVMRAEVLRVRTTDFVAAAELAGVRWSVILLRHILPHAAGPVLALAALQFGNAVIAISSLSFLGFGAQAPTPEWGNIISGGRSMLAIAWWVSVLPGTVIVLVVLAVNRISRYLGRMG